MQNKKLKQAALGAASIAVAATASFAGYTNIAAPYPGEQSTTQILSHTYNEAFAQVGLNYVGPDYTAIRVQDTSSIISKGVNPTVTPLNLGTGLPNVDNNGGLSATANVATSDPTDQLWSGNAVAAVAQARFALYGQSFGYFNGTTGSTYRPILDVTGTEYNVSGAGLIGGLNGTTFRFARTGPNATFSSVNDENAQSIDHMVTYEIVANGNSSQDVGSRRYMLFWDDKLPTNDADYDYNDMAIEIVVNSAVPEPTTLGLVGAGALLLVRRRR